MCEGGRGGGKGGGRRAWGRWTGGQADAHAGRQAAAVSDLLCDSRHAPGVDLGRQRDLDLVLLAVHAHAHALLNVGGGHL